MIALCAALAGCGSDDDPATPKTQAQEQEQEGPSDATQVRVLGSRYLKAYRRREWGRLCSLVAPSDRKRLTRRSGSCEKDWAREPRETTRSATILSIQEVRVDGDRARLIVGSYYDERERVLDRLFARKIEGRWWIDMARAERDLKRRT